MSRSEGAKGGEAPAARDGGAEAGPGHRDRFGRIAAAGVCFQGGSAAVDSSTVMAALVHQLTANAVAVGAVSAILRIGWVLPPLVVGYLAARRGRSMPFFVLGAFGRASAIVALAALLGLGGEGLERGALVGGFFVLWTLYAFASGIVAVPYNDIVARTVVSERRSRLLALRFFGGGVLALGVAAGADRLFANLAFPVSYAVLVGLAGALMLLSAALFASVGEPRASLARRAPSSFVAYLREGGAVFAEDLRFRRFVIAQWCGGGVAMAMPFYAVHAFDRGLDVERVAFLLGAQTFGAIASNALWGWWGDRHGKGSLMRGVAALRALPPLAMVLLVPLTRAEGPWLLVAFGLAFLVLGALGNALTIAVVGNLMELSPEDRRPAYTGYFNAMTAPAYLLPIFGGSLLERTGATALFALAAVAAVAQYAVLRRRTATAC